MSVKIGKRSGVLARLEDARLYCVTSPPLQGLSYEETVEKALKGGADIVQLREKSIPAGEMTDLGKRLRDLCRHHEALFIVNDRLDVALASGADGVHLGQDDLPLKEARKIAEDLPDFIIGVSTHSLDQALKAQSEGADYIGCGPIFSTPTKPDYRAQGLDLIRQYRQQIHIPFVAIGGMDETNIEEAVSAGARCVAAVRAVFGNDDIEGAVRSLKSKIRVP